MTDVLYVAVMVGSIALVRYFGGAIVGMTLHALGVARS